MTDMRLLVPDRGSRPVLGVVLLLAGMLVTLLLTTSRASAHAELVGSDPPDGAEVSAVPSEVMLNFSAGTGSAYVAVTGPDGTRAEVGEAAEIGTTVTQRLDSKAIAEPTGIWTIAYRVVSDDGHPITGELTFTVVVPDAKGEPDPSAGQRPTPSTGSVSSSEQSTSPPTESAPSPGSNSATWFAVAVGGGGLLYALATWWRRRRRHA